MKKADYYAKTEAVLHEYYTVDMAIDNIKRRKPVDEELLKQKEELKISVEKAINTLSRDDRCFLYDVLGNQDTTASKIMYDYGLSSSTYYRKKRNVIKYVALCLGFV